jgi:hypothetical protein
MNELNRPTQVLKQKFNKDMENIRRENQTEILEIKITL